MIINGARLVVDSQDGLGPAAGVDVTVEKTGQLFMVDAGTINGTFSIAGRGTTEGAGNLGALRLQNTTVTGTVNVVDDASIGNYLSSGTISATVNIADGKTLTLGASYGNDRVIIMTGSTVVGAGNLKIAGNAVNSSSHNDFTNVNLSGMTGDLIIDRARVRVNTPSDLGNAAQGSEVSVLSGGQIWLDAGGTYANTFNIAGLGWKEGSFYLGAMRLNDVTVTGGINLTADASICVNGTPSTISGNINVGEYALTLGELIGHDNANLTLSGDITGSGKIISSRNNQSLFLSGDNSGFTGTVEANRIHTYITTEESGSANAMWSIGPNGVLSSAYMGTGTIQLGGLTGTGVLRNDMAGTVTYAVGGQNTDTTFSGTIRDTYDGGSADTIVAIQKVGYGALTLNGTNTYTGGTTVESGRLNVSGSLAGDLTVNPGLTIDGTYYEALFSPGENNAVGTATIGGSAVINGKLLIEYDASGMDRLNVAGGITFGDGVSLELLGLDGSVLHNDESFVLFDTADTALPSIAWESLLSEETGLMWNLIPDGNTVKAVYGTSAVPEPASISMMILGMAGLLWLVSRKKRSV